MQNNSLSFRLTVSAAAVSLVLLLMAGLMLGQLFQQALQRNFDARLRAVLDGLAANVELKPDGSPFMTGALADTRFQLPESGWSWQVTPPELGQQSLTSASLLDKPLQIDAKLVATRNAEGIAGFDMTVDQGKHLRA
jgi:hypothetical protein